MLVALAAFWSVAGAGAAAAAPLALGSVVLVELDEAELLSFGTVLEELGAAVLVPVWLLELFMSVEFVLLAGAVEDELELEAAPGAVAAFWSVVVEGAAVGFAWPGVWSVTPGVVLVWPEVALGAVFDGVVLLWLELAAGV